MIHRRASRTLLLVSLSVVVLFVARQRHLSAAQQTSSPATSIVGRVIGDGGGCPTPVTVADSASLSVQVQYVGQGGAPPPPGVTLPPHVLGPAPQTTVQALPVGDGTATPVASGTTDDTGVVTLTLPPGSYWIVIPSPGGRSVSGPMPPSLTQLPDGTPVFDWKPVDLAPGDSQSLTLSLSVPLA